MRTWDCGDGDAVPAVSARQRRFAGAELGRKRAGLKTRTGMSESQLEEYATMKHGKHKTMKSAGTMTKGSYGDIGAKRQEESVKVGGFKAGATVKASAKL